MLLAVFAVRLLSIQRDGDALAITEDLVAVLIRTLDLLDVYVDPARLLRSPQSPPSMYA